MDCQFRTFSTIDDAYLLLQDLGASEQLIVHVKLVAEAAELLISQIERFEIAIDRDLIRLGVAFHDAGKIIHPQELTLPGNYHEPDGEQILIANGVAPKIARCCLSHARWQTMDCSIEELFVALADTLWKGKRNPQLEDLVIKRLAIRSRRDYWDLFVEWDSCFESIAADGDRRLIRSQL
jgi:hypothetical protein